MKVFRRKLAVTIALLVIFGSVVPVSVYSRATSIDTSTTQLSTLIQVASISQSYAVRAINSANNQGLNTSAFEASLASGNSSLEIAMADYSSNSNLTQGIQLARIAMSDFTNVSVGASQLLVQSGFGTYLEGIAELDSVTAANATAASLNEAISIGCKTRPANSSYIVQFQNYCSSGKRYVSLAAADLNQARGILSGAVTQAVIIESSSLIAYANSNLSLAAGIVSHLAQYQYYQRAQQFLAGPFAARQLVANNTVTAQRTVVLNFNADVGQFQTYQANQVNELDAVGSDAASLAATVQTALTATSSVSTAVSTEQTDLATASTDMTQLSSLVNTLPSTLVATLESDITAVQTDIQAASSSATSLKSQAEAFGQTRVNSITTYSSGLQSVVSASDSDNQALLSSLQTLQTELTTLASTLPVLSIWVTTTGSLYATLYMDSNSLSNTSQSAESDITGSAKAVSAYQSIVTSSSPAIEISVALLNSTQSVHASEELLLNATNLATVDDAVTSVQTTSQQSSSFVTQMNNILSTSVSGLGSSVQALSASASALRAQTSSTATALTGASGVISTDLQLRSSAFTAANVDASNALTMFADLQVSNGASLLTEANQELQIASS